MMNKLCFAGIMAMLIMGPASFAQDYQLVWSDEFEYDGAPDDSKWNYDILSFSKPKSWPNEFIRFSKI